MSEGFELIAQPRPDVGKGASRRLRRQGWVPAVIYGGQKDAESLSLVHKDLAHELANEAFYSSILNIRINGRTEKAILRDIQRHPFKPFIMHIDLQRVSEDQEIRVTLPLHFINEEQCRGVKQEGGEISHVLNEVEITCLPKDLPEFIEVDIIDLGLGETIHLSDLKVPEGVTLVELAHENDAAVVNVHHVRVARLDEEESAEDAEEGGVERPGSDEDTE
jgi:large subunit ribosomal protein L25